MSAIGMVEVFGLTKALIVADECLKTANVNLIGIENISSGIVTVKITGDVGAVTSSVNSVKDTQQILSSSVIPNIDDQAFNILKDTKRNVFKKSIKNKQDLKKDNLSNINEQVENKVNKEVESLNKNQEVQQNFEQTEQPEQTSIENNILAEANLPEKIEIETSEDNLIKDGLEQKTVKELIEMVVKLKRLTYKEAKKMKKDELINKLRDKN